MSESPEETWARAQEAVVRVFRAMKHTRRQFDAADCRTPYEPLESSKPDDRDEPPTCICTRCDGSGSYQESTQWSTTIVDCYVCGGSGRIVDHTLMLESVYGLSAPKLLARRTENLNPAVVEISGTPLTRKDGTRLLKWLERELKVK